MPAKKSTGAAAGGGAPPKSPTRAKAPAGQTKLARAWKLDKPRDEINHHIGVPYDHWDYANTAAGKAEAAKAKAVGTFKCLVTDFELLHQFPSVGAKAAFKADAFKLQLVDAEDDDSDEVFFLQYPQPYLRFRNSPESKIIAMFRSARCAIAAHLLLVVGSLWICF